MKMLRIAGFGLLLLCALLVSLPASWADWGLLRVSDGRFRLSACSGTVWRGSGILTQQQPGGSIAPLVLVAWRFQPVVLTSGEAHWQLSWGSAEGAVTWDWNGWRQSGLDTLQEGEDL